MKKRSGSKALVEALERVGADIVFGYPGGNVIDIFDEISRSSFRFVLGRHEQGCVHMADGYARASGRPAVVMVTSGPGLTNTITGLGAANMDGVPMVLVCGQVPLDQIGTDAFQEADTTGLTRAVSKHNFLVHSADEIPETVAQAFYIATHGKPGPVVIDVPRDCQQALTAAEYPERVVLRAYHPEVSATASQVGRLAKLVNGAKRPVILAGGGVIASGASEDVTTLAHKAGIPVATTLMGIGSFDETDPLSLGLAGLHGEFAANAAIAEADLLLALGVRFNDRVTGRSSAKFARRAKIVHVDCDPASINKNVSVDLGIAADVKELLMTVDSRIRPAQHPDWLAAIDARRRPRAEGVRPLHRGVIMPQAVVESVYAATKGKAIVVTDVGQHQIWAAKVFKHTRPRHFITSGGMGAMGFGIPAAIGAALARPDSKVVAFLGDGGAQMTAEELLVAVELRLPVTFVVLSNGSLGLVRQMQRHMCGGNYFATDISSPDFVKLAAAYGMRGFRVADGTKLDAVLARAAGSRKPTLVEVVVDREAEA
ncbi:MAG: biosynthetic-type acetolactate synthase large subunit [Kiritimatiellae bacterium]|nr:biosynthetic-type acetolactate synthase large subunit [Kiritimatiellia bacterium]